MMNYWCQGPFKTPCPQSDPVPLTHFPKQLHVHFGDAVDVLWALYGDVGGGVALRSGTKGSNGARTEQPQVMGAAHLQHIVETH